jgi:Na+-translocating ferredoxin:NAD+ oxidoreductase RNF subunit RnfB
MGKIIFYEDRCLREFECPLPSKCKPKAIIQKKPRTVPEYYEDLCTECRFCTKNCPGGAFEEEF